MKRVTANCVLGNKLLSIQFTKYHTLEQQERSIQPISSQEHCDAIPPMFSSEINWSEGFPNMVLSTEYSEAVNARYTFNPYGFLINNNTIIEIVHFVSPTTV